MLKRPNRIAEHRRVRGLTQRELAARLGASWTTISELERDRIGLTLRWMRRIADALGVSPSDLLPRASEAESVPIIGQQYVRWVATEMGWSRLQFAAATGVDVTILGRVLRDPTLGLSMRSVKKIVAATGLAPGDTPTVLKESGATASKSVSASRLAGMGGKSVDGKPGRTKPSPASHHGLRSPRHSPAMPEAGYLITITRQPDGSYTGRIDDSAGDLFALTRAPQNGEKFKIALLDFAERFGVPVEVKGEP